MTLNSRVLRKAQEEVDRVVSFMNNVFFNIFDDYHQVGRHRAPCFLDKDSLPYINAVIKEVIRWRVPLPLGEFHGLLIISH